MSMPGMRNMSATPPFRERLRQAYSNSPGPSNSPAPYPPPPSVHSNYPPKMAVKPTIPKAPKPPEKPLMPYMRYSRFVWDSVKAKNQELRLWEIGKIIGQMWRELPDSEKKEYNDAYEAEKVQYQENLKSFHNSALYQNYLREKQRAELLIEEEERRSKAGTHEPRVSIQPADYENDADGGMSVKHVAAARYHRNHALLNEIFSDAMVPDGRNVVTEHRMTVLNKQITALAEHQQGLERELADVTEKFEEKKRKFLESSEDFRKKLKEECDSKPVMTSAKFDSLVIKHKAELRNKYEKMTEQQKKEQELSQSKQESVAEDTVPPCESESAKPEESGESLKDGADQITRPGSTEPMDQSETDNKQEPSNIEPPGDESQDSQGMYGISSPHSSYSMLQPDALPSDVASTIVDDNLSSEDKDTKLEGADAADSNDTAP